MITILSAPETRNTRNQNNSYSFHKLLVGALRNSCKTNADLIQSPVNAKLFTLHAWITPSLTGYCTVMSQLYNTRLLFQPWFTLDLLDPFHFPLDCFLGNLMLMTQKQKEVIWFNLLFAWINIRIRFISV